MLEKLQHKYALSEKGTKDMVRAFLAVTIANLVLMLPVGLLYMLSSYLLEGEVPREKLSFFIIAIVIVLALIAITTAFQYRSTFLSTYVESGVRRRALAEKLRKIPLSYFGKKDLADPDKYNYVRLCDIGNSILPLDSRINRGTHFHNTDRYQLIFL